jgi:hypothetical protein
VVISDAVGEHVTDVLAHEAARTPPVRVLGLSAKNRDEFELSEPIDASNFAELFRRAQRTLGIRLRKFYATKRTYVSLALTRGVNLVWLSEQTGVAATTLLKHYGKFIHTFDADRAELSKIEGEGGRHYPRIAHEPEVENVTPRNRSWVEASPTEFEPEYRNPRHDVVNVFHLSGAHDRSSLSAKRTVFRAVLLDCFKPPARRRYSSRTARFRIFPVLVSGRASVKCTAFGTL